MRKPAFEPCLLTASKKVPDRPDWIYQIKHDGYRLIVQRDGKRVRLFTRNGYDWSDRYPPITEAALRIRSSSFVLDGEAVLLGVEGRSDFDRLHSRKHNDQVQFYAFRYASIRRRRRPRPPLAPSQEQPCQDASETRGRHLPVGLRTGRDRPVPIPARLPDGARGPCFQTSGPAVPPRPL